MKNFKKITSAAIAALTVLSLAGCGSSEKEAVKIGIPDDATNGGRAIKLLETAGLISVDPEAGWVPELKDVTEYIYNIEIVPTTANTLPSTLDDFGASTINNTYAIPAGLNPAEDGILREDQSSASSDDKNPYINVIVARTEDADNETFAKIVDAYHTDYVAQYNNAKYEGANVAAWDWTPTDLTDEEILEEVDSYKSSQDGKEVVRIGVCGASNDTWYACQKVLDDRGENIYLELVTFDAYTLPNEALDSGEIELNSFQHYAFLESEIASEGYDLTVIGDTVMAPLTLYSNKYDSVDALKEAAGKK